MANTSSESRRVQANEKIHMALIGCRGVGWANLKAHLKIPEVEFTALCDVDQSILEQRNNDFENLTGKRLKEYTDYRKLLEDKDLDAVIIATPDHWHAMITVDACAAGKDVYVEKPLANSLEATDAMVKAVRYHNRVCQVGQQQRSGPHWQNAIEYVHSGQLGPIRLVKTWAFIAWKGPLPPVPDSDPPEGVDYDMWLGPAPKRPYNKFRFHYNWRYWWDYAGGLMTDWGVHMLDIALAGMKADGPKSAVSAGGKLGYPRGAQDTPDTIRALYEFDDHMLTWEHAIGIGLGPYEKDHGVSFLGDNGTLVVSRAGWEVMPETDRSQNRAPKIEAVPFQAAEKDDRDLHAQDFVEAIKARKDPICPIENGANVSRIAQLGNISYRVGRKIYWDKHKGQIINDDEAKEMGMANYRSPWKLPVFPS
jgi:predicted dehydrogenase